MSDEHITGKGVGGAPTGSGRRAFLSRALAVGAGLPVAGGLLAACSGGDSGGSGFGSTSQPQSTSSGSAAKLSGQIVVAISSNPPDAAKQALADAYKAKQPGVDVVWQTKDFGDPTNYVSYLGTQLAAGSIKLDVVSGNYQPTFGHYVNFDELRGNINPYTGDAWDSDLDFDFYRQTNAAGERIMLATQSVHIMWFYNKDLFDKAGVTVPTNWSEFVQVCTKLKAAGITPLSSNYTYEMPQWLAEVYFDQYHVDWVKTVRAQKGDWDFNPAVDGKFTYDPSNPNIHTTYTYNLQRFYQALQKRTLRYDTGRVQALVANLAQVFPKYATGDFFILQDNYPTFLQQNVAMMINGSWSLPTLTNDLASLSPERLKQLKIKAGSIKPFHWGTFENPSMQGGLVLSKARSVESAAGEYVSIVDKGSTTTAVTSDFVMFWLSKAGYQPYMDGMVKAGQWNPAGPVKVNNLTLPKANQIFDRLKFTGNAEANYNSYWTGGAMASQTTDLHILLKNCLQGKISPKAYATQLQSYVMDHLAASIKTSGLTQADVDNPARRPTNS